MSLRVRDEPSLGYGLGLRRQHYEAILRERPRVDWFEILTENYLVDGGRPLHYLDRIRADYPLAMHGVSLSIGSADPLDLDYLQRVRRLAERIEPAWISDHLCWTGVDGINVHDLLPLPFTGATLRHVAERVLRVQDILGRRILLENVSSYFCFAHSTLPEWEFLRELAQRADCLLLVDVNNIHVAAVNHGFDAQTYLHALPRERVAQLHVAGHEDCGTHLIDTHDRAVAQPVWDLFAAALRLFGPVPVCIERDADVPPLADLLRELEQARGIGAEALPEPLVDGADRRRIEWPVDVAAEPALHDIQAAVQRGVTTAQAAAPGWLVETPAFARERRLGIYGNAYRARLVEALATDFGALQAYIGTNEFAELVAAYIGAHPSRHRSLRDVGQNLEAFLAAHAPYDRHVDLRELARFEWALCNAFDAADATVATHDDVRVVAGDDWERVRLRFHPSLQYVSLTGNAPALWRALNEERGPPDFVADAGETLWIVWRKQLQLLFRPLAAGERIALQAFREGESFGDVGALLAGHMIEDEVPPLLAGCIRRWLQDELIVAIDARAPVEP